MAIELQRTLLQAFRTDTKASAVIQYALLAAVTALATALVMRAYGTDVATRFDTINAALKQMGSGMLRP
jgi:Flp pilus assembly pilin Flp